MGYSLIVLTMCLLEGNFFTAQGLTTEAPCEKCCLPRPKKYASCVKTCVRQTTTPEVTTEEPKIATIVQNATIYDSEGSSYVVTVEDMCVFAHNYLREKHGAQDLVWDQSLADGSALYAKELAEEEKWEHSPGSFQGQFGENLFRGLNSYFTMLTPSQATLNWYSESYIPNNGQGEKDYNYTFNPTDSMEFALSGVGHFTAVVWNQTDRVGCGAATIDRVNKAGTTMTHTYVVARYLDTGNVLGQFKENVFPLVSGEATLKGNVTVSDVLPGSLGCKNVAAQCLSLAPQFCSIVKSNCNCDCP